MGSFFKQIYRYTHPRTYRHNETLWPHIKISRAITGEINTIKYRGVGVPIVQLSTLKGQFSGAIILSATGPSINEINFNPSTSLPSFGVNGAWYLDNFLDFSFYIIVDMGFFDNRPEVVLSIISKPTLTLFTTAHGIARIVDRAGIENIHCSLALIEDVAFKIYQPSLKPEQLKKHYLTKPETFFPQNRGDIGFTLDIRSGIFDAGTVAYWALQIIAFLGYEKIFILGLDMNNFEKPRFYESETDKLPTDLEGKVDDIIFPAFKHASNVLKEHKKNIINLSINSSIPNDTFQKASYDDTFFKED